MGTDPDGISKIACSLSLVDALREYHSQELPPTYARGTRCLDYALATPIVADAIARCGYEAFNSRHSSDHRAMYIDLNMLGSLFGTQFQPLAKHQPRMLQSHNVGQVTDYIRTKYQWMAQHNVFDRVKRLNVERDNHHLAERLDKDLVAASLYAKKKTRRMAEPLWSVVLSKARVRVQLLKKCVSQHRTRLNSMEKIRRDWIAANLDACGPPSTYRECVTELRAATREVQKLVSDSFTRRDEERQKRITELEASRDGGDATLAKVLRQQKRAEGARMLFRKLKALRSRQSPKQGLSRIEIPVHNHADPKTCTDWQVIDVPTEVVRHLRARNRTHFGQAHGTAFTVPPLSDSLGYGADKPAAEAILTGTFGYSGSDPMVHILLHHLRQTDEMRRLPCRSIITRDEFVGKLRVWRESTATSPSGLHLGHFKSMIARHAFSHVDVQGPGEIRHSREELDFKQNAILEVHLAMLNYALSRGYSFQRWQTVANTILFKEPDNIRIHRTRVIHIYEADYNLALGIKWRSAMQQAEMGSELNPGQFGSRKHKSAHDPVFLEELQLEMSRLTRKTLILTNYDATACYDRIIPNLAMLASRKFGVGKSVTAANAQTLEKATYLLRTDLGLATEGYTHSESSPIYGTGQGSGNSPAIWCFISSVLYDCYDQLSATAEYCAPDGSKGLTLGMVGFVDDSNGQTNSFRAPETSRTPLTVLTQMQNNAQIWSDLLEVSGGALELSKCSYHVVRWRFSSQGSPVLASEQKLFTPVAVTERLSGNRKELEYLPPHKAHKTLGHYKEPAGIQKTQLQVLKRQCESLTDFLWQCPLTREEACHYYYACYLPSISYPLSLSHFQERQLNAIQKKPMMILLARCGYNRHMKREIVFGPRHLGGAQFRSLYDQQGVGQILLFLRHWRSRTMAGKLLQCVLAWANFAAGMPQSILVDVTTSLPHVVAKWLMSLRAYLHSINAKIEVDDPGVPELEREYDSYIMDAIVSSERFTDTQVRQLNYCRLFLQAVSISDLSKSGGEELDPGKLRGAPSLFSSQTKWVRFHQERPSEAEWRLWRQANQLWSDASGRLYEPLGRWIHPEKQRRNYHFAYRLHNQLVVRKDSEYYICQAISNSVYEETTTITAYVDFQDIAAPVEVAPIGDSLWKITHSSSRLALQRMPQIATFEDHVAALDEWEQVLLNQITILLLDAFTFCYRCRQFQACSDGSVWSPQCGAFGWTIATASGERAALGRGPSLGPRQNSFRAECYGMLSIMRFLIQLAAYTDMIEGWEGVIATDSESLLRTLGVKPGIDGYSLSTYGPVILDPLQPEWDVLIGIQKSMDQLPHVKLAFVKGHQDKHRAYEQLPLLGQLNVDADAAANSYQQISEAPFLTVPMSPHVGAHRHLSTGTVTARFDASIRRSSTSAPLAQYIQRRNHWDGQVMASINWESHGKALSRIGSTGRQVHYSKLVHECLPTYSQLNKYDGGARLCPACHAMPETRDHILRCRHPSRQSWRRELMTALEEYFQQTDTYAPIRSLLRDALSAWFASEDDVEITPVLYPQELRRLVLQQNKIGWRQLFNGRFGENWCVIQDAYCQRPENQAKKMRNQSGLRWQTRLIGLLWDHWWRVWQLRNQDVHGNDKVTREQAARREVDTQLRALYESRYDMEPSVQQILETDVEQHVQRPVWLNRNWLAIHAPIVRESVRRVRERAIRGVRSIATYFRPVTER